MKKLHFTLLLFCIVISINAQDTYHSNLQNSLQTDFNLSAGDWIFYDNENQINTTAITYGANSTIENITDQDFSQKVIANVNVGANPWNGGWNIGNKIGIQNGDVVLIVFNIRSIGGQGKVNFFAENSSNFNKEVILTLPISEDWQQYYVPFEATQSYGLNNLVFGFHLAFQTQTIEIGGFTAINYKTNENLDVLPNQINNQFYEGWQTDAPWRAEAATRIDQFRKADLTVEVKESNGDPVENAAVNVEMVRHEFAFGTAITASRIAGNNAQNVIYENKLTNLDGEGHGFNWVVFENDMKWDAWEEEWFVDKTELVDAVQWLRNNDIKIRGHNLVWPGTQYLPDDIINNINDVPFVKNRINNHIEEVLNYPGILGEIEEWDVLNEIALNRDLENAFQGNPNYTTGRELYAEIFQFAKDIDPDMGLWLNDYVTLTLNNEPGNIIYDRLKQFTQEVVDANVGIEGMGFQGHIGGFPNGISSVLGIYDDYYNSFGLKAKVTEFDLPTFIDPELSANYLTDFLTATFSHESMDGFMFWSFWDGATYMNEGSNLFELDWSQTAAGDAFVDLVFNQWWTDEEVATDVNGVGELRVFKGTYEISYTCDGDLVTETVEILDPTTFTITCDNISTDVIDLDKKLMVEIFPNPVDDVINIKRNTSISAQVRLIDSMGSVLFQKEINSANEVIHLDNFNGLYFLELISDKEHILGKIIIK